jgi:FtsP/CotA-like multicopper oxidase with cupredoxin domain
MTTPVSEGPISAARRDFLKTGGALVVTFSLGAGTAGPADAAAQAKAAKTVAVDQVDGFLTIDAKGTSPSIPARSTSARASGRR